MRPSSKKSPIEWIGRKIEQELVVAAEGAAELDGGEAEFVAKLVGRSGQLFEFFAAAGFKKVELLRTVR